MRAPEQEQHTLEALASHFEAIIRLLGDDPAREGLRKTPMRAAKAMLYCTRGYGQDPLTVLNDALFAHEGSRLVVVSGIEFYSFCEHHILPFFGTVSVGYVPDGRIIGISKLARMVDLYARRLQVQERLTAQICSTIAGLTGARGVIVACRADHLCMKMRGVEKQGASTFTVEATGVLEHDQALRQEFFASLR